MGGLYVKSQDLSRTYAWFGDLGAVYYLNSDEASYFVGELEGRHKLNSASFGAKTGILGAMIGGLSAGPPGAIAGGLVGMAGGVGSAYFAYDEYLIGKVKVCQSVADKNKTLLGVAIIAQVYIVGCVDQVQHVNMEDFLDERYRT